MRSFSVLARRPPQSLASLSAAAPRAAISPLYPLFPSAIPVRCFSDASLLEQPGAKVALSSPNAARVLHNFNINFVIRGAHPLRNLINEAMVEPSDVLSSLEAPPAEGKFGNDALYDALAKNWTDKSGELVQYIIDHCHTPQKKLVLGFVAQAKKISKAHGKAYPSLEPLLHMLEKFNMKFQNHMLVEERSLFSRLLADAAGGKNHPTSLPANLAKIVMEDHSKEHHFLHALLRDIRRNTNNFTPDEGMPEDVRKFYADLAQADWEISVHTHLENNILFPAVANANLYVDRPKEK
eukprot:gb/GEZN01012343.1/.p1 GENE.gb/GEZN01012343.1/~~gb/GEZN01012343.1/.p1  ORF type:complete len:295 (+),score=46.27 gb/GEZN01012343.1/:91-975(+)